MAEGRVSGKTALVTGGASGIGAAIATALSEEGANLVISDLDEAAGAARAASLKNAVYLSPQCDRRIRLGGLYRRDTRSLWFA